MEKMNFTEALKSVQGTKFKIIQKYQHFAKPGFDIEDMSAEADMAIFEAYKEWDPAQSKFNTFVFKRIGWAIIRALENHNPLFVMNSLAKYDLEAAGETFETVKKNGKTTSEAFNELHGLDGSAEAKSLITKKLYKTYIQFTAQEQFGISFINDGQFSSDENSNFNIFEVVGEEDDHFDLMAQSDIAELSADKQKIAKLLIEGKDIAAVAKAMGMTKVKLLQKYAPQAKKTEVIKIADKFTRMKAKA